MISLTGLKRESLARHKTEKDIDAFLIQGVNLLGYWTSNPQKN